MASTSRWVSAGSLAQHLLRQHGPQTTQQLYKACLKVEAPAEKEYIAPHHKDYRIIGGQIRNATVRPPNPMHLVRSLRYLKQTMQQLESQGRIGHLPIARWMADTEKQSLEHLLSEAKEIQARNQKAGESPYVWIDSDRWQQVSHKPKLATHSSRESKSGKRIPRLSLSSLRQDSDNARL